MLLIYFYTEIQKRGLALQVRPSGTEVQTTNEKSRRPDVCIITNEQAQSIKNVSAIIQTPPPLVVEGVSPESIDRDYNRKTLEYATVGIPEYWIVDPLANQVTVCLLNQGKLSTNGLHGESADCISTFTAITTDDAANLVSLS